LQVSASHPALGASSTHPLLEIEVLPEWYQTYWARGTGLLLLALLGWALFERQRSRLKARHARHLERQQREFAEQLAEEKSRFLAQSSHEMKNLLGGATGMAELIVAQTAQPTVRDKAGRLLDLCADLSRLLDDLLDNARLERGQISLTQTAFDPLEVCTAVLHGLQPRAVQKGLNLRSELPRRAALRIGDPLRLRQIVVNLLSNAIKYTEHGEVLLCVDLDDPQWLRVRVQDTGPGIPAEAQAQLFTPFALGRNRRDSTGLGLWICRQLCDLCEGQIAVHSGPLGTAFMIELPWPTDADHPRNTELQLLIVASAELRARWLHAAAELGLPARGAETLLGVLSESLLRSASHPPVAESGTVPSVEIRVLLPGADSQELDFALSVLAARGCNCLPEAPEPNEPERYLASLLAARSR
jgi:signal transduction histidine kinase